MEEGEGFGEVALLYDDKRTATIVAKTDGAVWVLDGNIFKQIIIQSTKERRSTELRFLQGVNLFKALDKYEKIRLLDGLKVQWFKKGDTIIRTGDTGEMFYIVMEGHVECW